MNSHEVFIHIHQGCFAGTGAIVRLPQCQWSKPDGYGKISQCITTTKHSKAKAVCIFLGIYCNHISLELKSEDFFQKMNKMAAIHRQHFEVHFPDWKCLNFNYNFTYLGTIQATIHYLNQWWPCSLIHKCITWVNWILKGYSIKINSVLGKFSENTFKHKNDYKVNTLKQAVYKMGKILFYPQCVNIGRNFTEGIFKCIFLNENVWIPIKVSLKFVPKGPINNIPALVQATSRPGDKPLSEPMMVRLPTHICVTRPQWVHFLICFHSLRTALACAAIVEISGSPVAFMPYMPYKV